MAAVRNACTSSVLLASLLSGILGSYVVDDRQGLGRRFDGIGGISGGGATSKLLPNYLEPQRSEILDYLFKPNFGASLQILKVEIGGDSQTSAGTESSHMHEETDENYQRGYEWWLMTEAKKRNPDIKLVGLPWSFPGWLGEGTKNPFINPVKTATYITKWILGAKKYYNLTIDYIGSWNERSYSRDYALVLRRLLDSAGLAHVRTVWADDGGWGVADDILRNTSFASTVDVIGVHYPGTYSSANALLTNKTLWASEDYSTFNDNVGAGCWARIMNQNYVNGHMTSTISWNLIASSYNVLPWMRCGLMTAVEPWSGHYTVESPIWVTAHTTQFTGLGWRYLQHGAGVGHLAAGGSYVALRSPDSKHLTLIIETMQHDHSICVRPYLPAYTVKPQNASFILKGSMASISTLNVWHSKLAFNGGKTILMEKKTAIPVIGGRFSLYIGQDEIYTLTTMTSGRKGVHPAPPASKPFPLPYKDDFEGYPLNTEAYNFVPQIGVWEVHASGDAVHGQVNAQVIQHDPVDWCYNTPVIQASNVTINVGGNFNWTDISIEADVFLPGGQNSSKGAFLGIRVHVEKGGCHMVDTDGIYIVLNPDTGLLTLARDMEMENILFQSEALVSYGDWFTVSLQIKGLEVEMRVTGQPWMKIKLDTAPPNGFVAYGTIGLGMAMFDNVHISGI